MPSAFSSSSSLRNSHKHLHKGLLALLLIGMVWNLTSWDSVEHDSRDDDAVYHSNRADSLIRTAAGDAHECSRLNGGESDGSATNSSKVVWDEECVSIVAARRYAEALWKNQQGYLWMQHSRKAGGTTLCMKLRLNVHGLVRVRHSDHETPARKTCQIRELCVDCDMKAQPWYSVENLPIRIKREMDQAGRNFIELEGSGVPVDMAVVTDSKAWEDVVFVSTLRDPIDRIVSLLYHARPCHLDEECFAQKKRDFVKDVQRCNAEGIYFCHSNYYVRIFSGLDMQYTTDQDMLERAKRNFMRFSCVGLLEQWDESLLQCLASRLGLYLRDDVIINLAGDMKSRQRGTLHNTTLRQHLTPDELRMITSFNQVDIEFYEWAKQYILSSSYTVY